MASFKTRTISSADANTTVVVKGAVIGGMLSHITINTTSAHALSIYEGQDATNGTLIATLKASVVEGTYWYKAAVSKGLCIVVPSGYVGNATISFN